jgi:ABC-2 type transport system permease protein
VKVSLGTFARLKLRILGNGFRGRTGKVLLFVLGLIAGVGYGGLACLMFIAAMAAGEAELTRLIPPFAGSLLVLGWLMLPLVWFGVDDTLDPARFALLPLPRWTLLRGLLVGALLGVPAAASLLALSGLAIGAAIAGGPVPALVATIGVVLGLLLCVVLSRAVTSGFSQALRARRTRDLAAVLLAVLAASIGPIQLLLTSGAKSFGLNRMEALADALGWTPFGAPFVVGADAIAGHWAAAAGRLGLTTLTIAVLMWWWSRSVDSAMLGTVGASGPTKQTGPLASPVARLFGRNRQPRTAYGALVVRELRYWFRDARRRASLITFAVVGVFLPVMTNLGPLGSSSTDGPSPFTSTTGQAATMLFVGALAAVGLANQFGFDGTSYAANVIVGISGRLELRSRVVAYSWLIGPFLVLLACLTALLRQAPGQIPLLLGMLLAAYGAGVACCMHVSVLGAYALPENSNPFAINTGAGVAKSLLAMVAWFGGMVLALPMLLLVIFAAPVAATLALPLGLAYCVGAIWLGLITAGDVLDRRQPELLAAVTPRG